MTIPPIAREILSYVAENPTAEDCVEGITGWWLLKQSVTRRVTEVRQALEELVAMRYLVKRRGTDSNEHYQINPAKLREIRALLRDTT